MQVRRLVPMGAVLTGAALFGAAIGGVVNTNDQLRAAAPAEVTTRDVADHGPPGDCPFRDPAATVEERL